MMLRFLIIGIGAQLIFAIDFAVTGGQEQNVNETIFNAASATVAALGWVVGLAYWYLHDKLDEERDKDD